MMMVSWILLYLHVILALPEVLASYEEDSDRPVAVQDIHVFIGDSVDLPCDVTSIEDKVHGKHTVPENSAQHSNGPTSYDQKFDEDNAKETKLGSYLVLWFIDPDRKPIYSFDVRGRPSTLARHSWDKRRFENRAHFFLSTDSKNSLLRISNVTLADAGVYRCRVDHQNAPTKNFKYRLVVVEPPSEVQILNSTLQQLDSTTGPIEEGSDLILTCRVIRGNPSPWVTWWQNGRLIDNSTDFRAASIVSNQLVLQQVSRRHVLDSFICQVSFSPVLKPITKTITLNLLLKPLNAEIIGPKKPLSANQSTEFRCRTSGSKPAAVITWWIGGTQIYDKIVTLHSADGNETLSILTLTLSHSDDGKLLYCRAANPSVPASAQEDFIRLDVQYSPIVRLALGSNINSHSIREADDLYLECHIVSNPRYSRLSWAHNGIPLMHNTSAGIVFSNVSLVLQSVARQRAGNYTCSAANSKGETTSAPIFLKIHYAPRCRSPSEDVVGVSRLEAARLQCQVDAEPPDVQFWWSFLGVPLKLRDVSILVSNPDTPLLPKDQYSVYGTSSSLSYTPKTESDYGTIACWAANQIGSQRHPCIFRVIPAGKPKAPLNCVIRNRTEDFVHVECQEAFNGGLQQTFGLEVVDLETQEVKFSISNSKPSFEVHGLEPESAFLLSVYAVNSKGRSEEVGLETGPFKVTEKQRGLTGFMPAFQMSPLLGVVTGTAVTLVAVVVALAIVFHKRQKTAGQVTKQGKSSCDTDANGTSHVQDRTTYPGDIVPLPNCSASFSSVGEPNLLSGPDLVTKDTSHIERYYSTELSATSNVYGLKTLGKQQHGVIVSNRLPESFL